jgi:hypothetical protein
MIAQPSAEATRLDQLSITAIPTRSMDAVQQASSGYLGTPMAIAPSWSCTPSAPLQQLLQRHGSKASTWWPRPQSSLPGRAAWPSRSDERPSIPHSTGDQS